MGGAISSTKYGQWIQITNLPSGNGFKSVDTDGDSVAVTNLNDEIYVATRTISSIDSNSSVNSYNNDIFTTPSWIKKPGGLSGVSISNNKIIGFNSSNDVYYSSGVSTSDYNNLTSNSTTGKMKTISYYNDNNFNIMCGVRAETNMNNFVTFTQYKNNTWVGNQYQIGSSTKWVSLYKDNIYIILNDNRLLFSKSITTVGVWANSGIIGKPNNNTTVFTQIDFTDNLVVAIDTNNKVWATYDVYNSNPYWFQIPNVSFKYISVSNNGIMGIDLNNNLYGLQYTINPIYCSVTSVLNFVINYFPVPGSNIKSVTLGAKNVTLPSFYTECQYSGTNIILDVGNYDYPNSLAIPTKLPNDSLSSLKIPQGYTVTLYSDNISNTTNPVTLTAVDNDNNICCLNPSVTCNPLYTGINYDNIASSIKVENNLPKITYNLDGNIFKYTQSSGTALSIYSITSKISDLNMKGNNTYTITLSINLDTGNSFSYNVNYRVPPTPDKVIINNVTSNANNIGINFNIPNAYGSTPSCIVRKYTDKNTCSYKTIYSTDVLISGKSTGTPVTYNYPVSTRKSFIGDTSNLTTNCTQEGYEYLPYKHFFTNIEKFNNKNNKKHEAYIFTLKAINSIGESDYSEPTTDVIPIISPAPSPSPSPSPSPAPSPSPSPSPSSDNKNLYIVIGVIFGIILIGGAIWYFNKNK